MEKFRLTLFAILFLVVAVKVAQKLLNTYLYIKSVNVVEGHLAYTNDTIMPVGRFAQGVSYPIYRYQVDGVNYFIELNKPGRHPGVFPLEVEVRYYPLDPEVGFIHGMRGRLVSKVGPEIS